MGTGKVDVDPQAAPFSRQPVASMSAERAPRRFAPILRGIGVVAAIVALLVVGRFAGGYIPVFAAWVNGLGVWGPLVFVTAYALSVVVLFPAVLLTLAGGAIFGLLPGTLYVFCGAVLGSIGAFLVARYFARRAIEARLTGNPRFAAIDRAIGAQGLRIVFLLRLSPVFPFTLLNYALGLTRVKLRDYVVASFGMIPGTLLYVYYGKLAGDFAALGAGHRAERGAGYYAVLVTGLVATALATTVVTRTARHALREATGEAV
jgi:uncharacterized membrane protein YdjX (TVP38/TMEM64 family)